LNPTREERATVARRTHTHHGTDRPVPANECPRCPRWRDAAAKLMGKHPQWYPSRPPRILLQCQVCGLVWDTRT